MEHFGIESMLPHFITALQEAQEQMNYASTSVITFLLPVKQSET
jgi:hypothetical protein